jgi:hypothetical protein
MPIGNGNLAANVWADNSTGSILLLVSKADAWNEAAELIKVAMLNITLSPNPFVPGSLFRQELVLENATVHFALGQVAVDVYAHADVNTIMVHASSKNAFGITAETTLIRTTPQTMMPSFDCNKYTIGTDSIVTSTGNSSMDSDTVIVYHRNSDFKEKSYFTQTLKGENIFSAEMSEVRNCSNQVHLSQLAVNLRLAAFLFARPSLTHLLT